MTLHATEMPHPGDFILEELQARDWLQRDLAFVLGVPEQAVNLIVSGKRGISADMAKALGDAFDVAAEFFMNLQQAYDLARARTPDPGVAKKGKLQSCYPVREMIKRGWLLESDAPTLELQMTRFFEVASVDDVPHVNLAHAAKKSVYDEVPAPQLAWLFRVRQLAREMVVRKYSKSALTDALAKLRPLMVAPEGARHVPKILAECGVRFVIVECLPGSKIDGVCFWLDNNSSPVIGLSLRYDRIDNFWFVLRHEIEHVLRRHGVDAPVIDSDIEGVGTGENVPEQERVANAAASDFCVPTKQMDSFVARKSPFFSERDLLSFAKLHQVHPGIVAGQLRRRINNWKIFTKHLAKVRLAVASSAVVDGWGQIAPAAL